MKKSSTKHIPELTFYEALKKAVTAEKKFSFAENGSYFSFFPSANIFYFGILDSFVKLGADVVDAILDSRGRPWFRADGSGSALREGNATREKEYSSVSFVCLARILGLKDPESLKAVIAIGKMAKSGDLQMIDFTPDEQHKGIKSPGPGFTALSGVGRGKSTTWHRSGTAVFWHRPTNRYFVLGQDEDSYFGSELPPGPAITSVTEAFSALMPKELRGVDASEFVRQGEWFFHTIQGAELSKFEASKFSFHTFDNENGRNSPFLTLSRETENSNRHRVCCETAYILPDGGLVLSSPIITHPDHAEVHLSGYHRVYRNTAVRSVSVEGVD